MTDTELREIPISSAERQAIELLRTTGFDYRLCVESRAGAVIHLSWPATDACAGLSIERTGVTFEAAWDLILRDGIMPGYRRSRAS